MMADLPGCEEYVCITYDGSGVCLDGDFTDTELMDIIDIMREKQGQKPPAKEK